MTYSCESGSVETKTANLSLLNADVQVPKASLFAKKMDTLRIEENSDSRSMVSYLPKACDDLDLISVSVLPGEESPALSVTSK